MPTIKNIELVQGDSLAWMQKAATGSVSVITTSPPYNIGIRYASGYDDTIPRADYLRWTRLWLGHARRIIEPAGSLFLNVAGKPSDPWGPHEVLFEARAAGWVLQNTVYWIKHVDELDAPDDSIGHFKPINSPRYITDCGEPVYHLTPEGTTPIDRLAVGVPYADKSNLTRGTRGKNGDRRCRGNVWVIPYPTIQRRNKDRPHPATYPPELAEQCFKLHGLSKIKMTLDPFSGLGSSARAAARLGLPHVGVELGEEDVREAHRLLLEEFGARPMAPVGDPAAEF